MKPAWLAGSWLEVLAIALAALIPPTTLQAALGRLGAKGDSLTDEYWDSGVSTYATNWPGLLVLAGSIASGNCPELRPLLQCDCRFRFHSGCRWVKLVTA
jgi:hypothetical protein